MQIQCAYYHQVLCQALNSQSFRCGLDCGAELALSGGPRHNVLLLGPYFEAVSTSLHDPSRHGPPGSLIASSASEYASGSPLCCQRNQHLALGFPTRYRPILVTRSMSRTGELAIAQETCIDAKLRSGRSCECSVLRDVTTCECLAVIGVVTCHLRSVPVVTVVHVVPLGFSLDPSLSSLVLSPLPSSFLSTAHGVADWFAPSNSRPFSISLTCLWSASIVMSSRFHAMTLKVWIFRDHLFLNLVSF